jgi:hypothetical protein
VIAAAMHPTAQGHFLTGLGCPQFPAGMSFVHNAPPILSTKITNDHKEKTGKFLFCHALESSCLSCSWWMGLHKINRPSHVRRAIGLT